MKKTLLSVLTFLLCNIAYSQYKYELNIHSSLPKGSKIYFCILDNNNLKLLRKDSLVVKNKEIVFNGTIDQPSHFVSVYIKNKGRDISTGFILDSGKNTISILPNQAGVLALKRLPIKNKSNEIFDRLNEAKTQKEQSPSAIRELVDMLKKYPDDHFSVLALYQLSHYERSEDYSKVILKALSLFNEDLQNSALGQEIFKEQSKLVSSLESVKTGKTVPDFSILDDNGKLFQNESLKGKPYLIVFSATWCGPCQKQLPMLKQVYEKYKPEGLKVVYFNNDSDVERWKEHIRKNKLTWINVSERLKPTASKIQKSFGVYGIPTCLLVDKQGVIVYNSDQEDTGLVRLESNVRRALQTKSR
jgi:thiol-disulfide isomerase/thioredoxin